METFDGATYAIDAEISWDVWKFDKWFYGSSRSTCPISHTH